MFTPESDNIETSGIGEFPADLRVSARVNAVSRAPLFEKYFGAMRAGKSSKRQFSLKSLVPCNGRWWL